KIHVVDRLIHEGPAAVEGPRPFPAAFVIVGLRAPPFTRGLRQRKSAKATGVHGSLERLVGVAEARRENRAQLDTVPVAGVDDAIASCQGDLERLLNDDVFSG